MLISSYILTELSEICDACAIIEQGKLLATGPVDEILARTAGSAPHSELVLELYAREGLEASMQKAERLLLEQPLVTKVNAESQTIRVRVELAAGTQPTPGWIDEAAARLIKVLVQAELPVCGLKKHELDLEDAFMTVTKGKVQ